MRDRMRRAAQADRVLAGGGGVGRARHAADDHRHRPGPERLDEALGERRDHAEALGAGTVGDVDDQRMAGRPALASRRSSRPPRRRRRARRGRRRSRSERRPARPRRGAPRRRPRRRHRDRRRSASLTSRRCRGSPPPRGPTASAAAALARGQGQVAHLSAGPRLALAVEMQVRAGQREHAVPRRLERGRRRRRETRGRRAGSASPPANAAAARPAARRPSPAPAGRTARRRRHRCCSGPSCAAAAPSRWRRAHRPRARTARRRARRRSRSPRRCARASGDGLGPPGLVDRLRRHPGQGQDAVAVDVLLHRQGDDLAAGRCGRR